ncbi:MAG: peptide chain release factor-like protein [Phycisphaerales bacterium]|nr:peptide chain release factor-like protein [Phycisphaerales bacterium]
MHPAVLPVEELLKACRMTFGKKGGPGGQHRNKVATAVEIKHLPTGVCASAGERRSQAENRAMATRRLRMELALTQRGYFSLREVPTELWQSRCSKSGRLSISPHHADYPAMLAEAMDVLDALHHDLPRAAGLLGCTASQLLKLLKDEPAAWVWLNQKREAAHQHPLR